MADGISGSAVGFGGGGSGGGIHLNVNTLAGAGLIRAAGGDGINVFNDQGYWWLGGGGGGGRIAVYARDYSGFNTANITAPGGTSSQVAGGVGTVYLRDPDEPSGTLIIDAGNGGNGVTPLGLPGQTSFTIPDAVVIRGGQTHVQPEHPGLGLQFQNTVMVDQGASLAIEGPSTSFAAPVTVQGSARMLVSGDLALGVPLNLTGGGLVQVDGTLKSSVDQIVDGGTFAGSGLVAPNVSVVNNGVLTSLASTSSQMHNLEVQVDGTLSVDSTSRIDVTGDGYLAGRTTGNSTFGGATFVSGGSYGGLGGTGASNATSGGTPNAVYGDPFDPAEPGSGGGDSGPGLSGGGSIRVNAQLLQLDGAIVADGISGSAVGFGGGGSGGGIYLNVNTLAGAGLIRAAGGDGFDDFNDQGYWWLFGGGGGGRIAVYARDYSGFNTANITAPGGTGSQVAGGPGSVWIVQGQPHTHVQAHFPFGIQQGFVDHGNGFVNHR